MTHASPPPPIPLPLLDKPDWFRQVVGRGIEAVGRLLTPHPVLRLLIPPLQRLLSHSIAEFARLFAAFRAGTLVVRPPATRASHPRTTPPRKPVFPLRRGWLTHALGHDGGGFASQLDVLLAQPDMAAFLAASPQARRLLRPIRHMLGISPPPRKPLARRPRAPRPADEIPPHRSIDPLTKRTAKRPYWMPSPRILRRERAIERLEARLAIKPNPTG